MTAAELAQVPEEVRQWLGEQLFDQVPSNIVVIDRDHNVVLANRHFEEVFGPTAGKRCYQVYKGRESVCEQCLAVRSFEDGQVHVNDEEGIDQNGKAAHFVVYTAPVRDARGEITHVIEMSYDVTETKSLQRSYNILFERAPCYVAVINRDLRIVRANERLQETFGDHVGEHCYRVYKQRADRCPDCPALKTFADGRSYQAEQVGVDKNGRATYYAVSTTPLARSGSGFSHVIEMSTDVTALRSLSDELIKEHSFNHTLIDGALDALVAADPSGEITTFNKAAEELFQVPAGSVVGKVPSSRFLPREFPEAMAQGQTNVYLPDTKVKDNTGQELPVRFSGSLLKDGERVIGSAAFFHDLRRWKQLQRENLDNERLAAVGQTVAQLAHGIKNILNGLQGGMYIIKSGTKSGSEEKIQRGWSMLDRNVERITMLVKGFLGFAKGFTPQVRPTDPNAVAQEVHDLYAEAAAKQGITLRFEPCEGIAPAPMDYEDIHTCLTNLVSNAIDACQASDQSGCDVTIRVSEEGRTLVMSVQDSGCGMDYEIKKKVFTTFFTTKGLSGTGLGLLVTRKIVQEHGGRISVDSAPGTGSEFRMEFPRDRMPKPGKDGRPGAETHEEDGPRPGLRAGARAVQLEE